VHELAYDKGSFYLVSNFIQSQNIRQIIQQHGVFSLSQSLDILHQVSLALSYAHQKGLMHFNLKSSNILLDSYGKAYLTDFAYTQNISLKTILEDKVETDDIFGTFGYLAPELLYPSLGPPCETSDIYSLGVILFEMLSGRLPFCEQRTPITLAHMHIAINPPRLAKLQPKLLPQVDQMVMKMLNKDPMQRFLSIKELQRYQETIKTVLKQFEVPANQTQTPMIEIIAQDHSFSQSYSDFSKSFHRNSTNMLARPSLDPEQNFENHTIQERYRVDKLIHRFILSNFYLGYDLKEDLPVSIQIANFSSPAFNLRIQKEYEKMKNIQHPAFLQLLDLIKEEERICIIRESTSGRPFTLIAQSKKLKLDQVVRVSINLLEVLAHLHQQGILHRDLNSKVIYICKDYHIQLVNLVISRSEDESSVSSGAFMGMVQYAAPEQVAYSHYDIRSDLYSVGVLMFELLTGKPPFDSDQPIEVMDMLIKKSPRFTETCQKDIPISLQSIVLKTLSKNPDHRYQSANSLIEDLKDFLISYTNACQFPCPQASPYLKPPPLPAKPKKSRRGT